MAIALFSEILAHFPAQRARVLKETIGLEAVYALVWPNYTGEVDPHPQNNREAFHAWRAEAGVPVWAWVVCSPDQAADARAIEAINEALEPDGWLLNIEKPLQGANLSTLIGAAKKTGAPVRASLAGTSASHVHYDYRTLDRNGVAVDWQAYFDSGEGPPPADAVRELYESSFVIPGWHYRHLLNGVYGWGAVSAVADWQAQFDSFLQPAKTDATFVVGFREWGYAVFDRELWRSGSWQPVGRLMGRAAYRRIRVTLDVTRSAQARRPEDWTAIAASARVPRARKRDISVYLGEVASDTVLAAIAAGAA